MLIRNLKLQFQWNITQHGFRLEHSLFIELIDFTHEDDLISIIILWKKISKCLRNSHSHSLNLI